MKPYPLIALCLSLELTTWALTWTPVKTRVTGALRGGTYGNGIYMVTMPGPPGGVITSTDVIQWTYQGLGGYIMDVAYGSGTFVASGGDGWVYVSRDATNWTSQFLETWHDLQAILHDGRQFVIAAGGGLIYTSPDGNQWTRRSSTLGRDLYGIAFGGGRYVAAGSQQTVVWSDDVAAWYGTMVTSSFMGFHGVGYGNGMWVAVGNPDSQLWSSPDGERWTRQNPGITASMDGVTYACGRFWVSSYSGQIISSTDGVNWAPEVTGVTTRLEGIKYLNGRLLAFGDYGVMIQAFPEGEPVTIRCPSDLVASHDAGLCSAMVEYSLPVATAYCAEVPTSCDPPPGALFPIGSTTVTCTATDGMGHTAACSFRVTVARPVDAGADLNTGLVGFYPFNGNADDASGRGHSGTVMGATLTEDRFGIPNRAFFFRETTSGDKIKIASFPELDNRSQATWVWWAKRTNSPPLPYHSHVLRKAASWILFQWANDPIPTTWRSPLWFNENTTWVAPLYGPLNNLNDGGWHCYAVVFANRSLNTYVDGLLLPPVSNTGSLGLTLRASSEPFYIGGDEFNSGSFGGWLDDIRIYDRALSHDEILALVNLPPPGAPLQMECPGDLVVSADRDQCSASVNYPPPTATANCADVPAICIPPAGSTFPIGPTTVHCTATDTEGNSVSCAFRVTVADTAPPVITCPAGTSVSVGPGCEAPVPDLLTGLSVSDNCTAGNGLRLRQDPPAGTLVGPGTTAISLSATDAAGNQSSCRTDFRVVNTAPSITKITGPDGPLSLGSSARVTLDFADEDALQEHTVTFSWGDGASTTITADPGVCAIAATHAYAGAGVYAVGLTVTDPCGASASATFEFVVIYDPNGGFVTGGGWIHSPAGALASDPSLAGKATFGFVSKYKPGAHLPSGSTEFQFKAGDFSFRSTAYEWLVVAGAKAQFKGTGTVNGSGRFDFLLSAVDGERPGGGGTAKFRIKITDAQAGAVYDNMLGASDDLGQTDPQAIAGGSVVVHKP